MLEGAVMCVLGSISRFPGWMSLPVVCGLAKVNPYLGCELDAIHWKVQHTDPDDFSAIANCLRCKVQSGHRQYNSTRAATNSRERGLARAWRPEYLGHLSAKDASAPLVQLIQRLIQTRQSRADRDSGRSRGVQRLRGRY
jgi:hypothetical protein